MIVIVIVRGVKLLQGTVRMKQCPEERNSLVYDVLFSYYHDKGRDPTRVKHTFLLFFSLRAMIPLSTDQLFAPIPIHNAILVVNISAMLGTTKVIG